MILIKQKPDSIGALASTLCLIHCIVTPFIFIIQSSAINCCNEVPTWWGFLDYFFLIISFFAVFRSTQITSKNWIKPLLWISWFVLFVIIMNEKIGLFELGEKIIYIPALTLTSLHLYNRKHCQCNENKCCTNEG